MASSYRIELAPAAQRQLKKLPLPMQRLIVKQLEILQKNPRPKSIKKLSGMDHLYRMRLRDYRILYSINDQILLILILKIGHRKEVYRHLN